MGDAARGKRFRDRIEWLVRRGVPATRPPGVPPARASHRTVEAVKARREELLKSGRFIDVTEAAMRQGLGAVIITGLPDSSRKKVEPVKGDPPPEA
jgi:hypothetical protein